MKSFLKIFSLLLFLMFAEGAMASPEYYQRHYIIVVDQAPFMQRHPNVDLMYKNIRSVFCGTSPSNVSSTSTFNESKVIFDPQTDQISLFYSGISQSDYKKIQKGNNDISKKLIHKCNDFRGSNLEIENYLEQHLKPLLSNGGKMSNNFKIGLNAYLYPIVLAEVDNSIPARDYYVFVISYFNSAGQYQSVYESQVKDLLKKKTKRIEAYDSMINSLKGNFTWDQNDIILTHNVTNANGYANMVAARNFNPKLLGAPLMPKSTLAVGLNLLTAPSLKQEEYLKSDFELSPTEFTFPNNSDEIRCNKIEVEVTNSQNQHVYKYVIAEGVDEVAKLYDNDKSVYNFPKKTEVYLPDIQAGDTCTMKYIFFADILDKEGNVILPKVFTSEVKYELREADMKIMPLKKILAVLIIILALAALILTYILRGKFRKVNLQWRIWPVSNTRFMEVKNKKVINYDCWYWQGVNDTQRSIQIDGSIDVEAEKKFAKNCKYKVEYCIHDIDTNYDFTFRPATLAPDGSYLRCGEYYEAALDANNHFSTAVIVYLDNVERPNFEQDNILELKVTIRVSREDKKGSYSQCLETSKKYMMIVKPQLEDPTLWVAFDPGTTGSCVAYGKATNIADPENIYLARNKEENLEGSTRYSHIFPSKIKLLKTNTVFGTQPVEEYVEGHEHDFLFGNQAQMLWGENSFQSIKKLLGYTTPLYIHRDALNSKPMTGSDLAHLLVKGLYNHFRDFVLQDPNVNQWVRGAFMKTGKFVPQRAIVAVPNNYTLTKVQEMVDSVKRLGKFNEVHYLYESEGVFMTYLHKEFSQLLSKFSHKKNQIFIVYDMGGATINITAFKLNFLATNGTITQINVETVAKIGYTVGGDDIDFSLIQLLYQIPTIKDFFGNNKGQIKQHQIEYKNQLIDLVRNIKLDWIDHINGQMKEGNVTSSIQAFWGHISYHLYNMGILLPDTYSENDEKFLKKQSTKHTVMNKYVYQYVKDAVQEMARVLDPSSDVELIMSGRSTLYPNIKETVSTVLQEQVKTVSLWNGFNDANGMLDDELVKTAVATGACWYAMNSGQIILDHSRLTSTFGYIDVVNGKQQFIPVIDRSCSFDEYGTISASAKPQYHLLSSIRFAQMLGTNYEEIFDGELKIKHKMNILDDVSADVITGQVENIEISVDDKNNFNYAISVFGLANPITSTMNPNSRLGANTVRTEIADENSEAYIYATVSSNSAPQHITAPASQTTAPTPSSDPTNANSQTTPTTRF